MELQFRSDTCRCLTAASREVRAAELTQEVRISDGMPDIGRVLASWGQIILRTKEWQSDQVMVSGGVMVWILYAPEDGTQPRCMDTWIPFQLKWELGSDIREGPVRIGPLLRFVDSRGISARKMMVRVSLAAMAEVLSPITAEVFRPMDLPEDIQLLRNTYPVRLPVEAGEKTFLLDEDLAIPAGNPDPERLLAYTIEPQIREVRIAGDKVILRGSGNLRVIYRCGEGKIHTVCLEVPVSQYIQLENTYGNDAQADVMLCITGLELMSNEGGQLRLKCGMVVQYLISDRYLAEVTEDAYSPNRDVMPEIRTLALPALLEQKTDMVVAHQQLPGVTGEVADVTFLPDFPRQTRTGDKLMLDLPAWFQVLYYTPEGTLQGATARWEGNMQIPADPDCDMAFLPHPYGAQAVSAVEEMNLTGQYGLRIQTSTPKGLQMVVGLDVGQLQEKNPARPSLILCRPEGESLWEMAKRCGSTVEAIRQVNGLNDQLADNRMLLVPVK